MKHEEYLENAQDFLRKHLIKAHGYPNRTIQDSQISEEEVSAAHRWEHTNSSTPDHHRHTD